jgi:AcrR family transcriptional regulator
MSIETKEKLLKVATHLFAEKGFHNTSIRDIAQKTKVNSSMISYYFKSKNGLFEEILKTHTEKVLKLIKTPEIERLSPNKKIIAIFEAINDAQTEEMAYIIARALLNKNEKTIYRIMHDCFVKEITPLIKNVLKQCTLNPKYSAYMTTERLGLALFTTTKLWLLYSEIILDTSDTIKTKRQLEQEIGLITKGMLKEFLSDD